MGARCGRDLEFQALGEPAARLCKVRQALVADEQLDRRRDPGQGRLVGEVGREGIPLDVEIGVGAGEYPLAQLGIEAFPVRVAGNKAVEALNRLRGPPERMPSATVAPTVRLTS